MNAHQRIKAAQRRNERKLLAYIRMCQREQVPQRLRHSLCTAWANALERLLAAGRVAELKDRTGWFLRYVIVKGGSR